MSDTENDKDNKQEESAEEKRSLFARRGTASDAESLSPDDLGEKEDS